MSQEIVDKFPLFETIKVEERVCKNLSYHFNRMKASCKQYWGKAGADFSSINFNAIIDTNGLLKLKLYYNLDESLVSFTPYKKREITELIIIEADDLLYDLKYTDRTCFSDLTHHLAQHQDIIIEKNGYLSDSSYANLALWDGENWVTPKKPLLKGTKRAYYLHEQMLVEKNIRLKDLGNYSKISLINSMLDLGETVVDIQHVSLA